MIKLYGFGQAFGVADASPFVVKVDLFLKLSGIEFEYIGDFNQLKKSPKNKLPFIDDNGKKIGDSAFILKYLTNKYEIRLDEHLTEIQKSQAALYAKALDESLYWCLVYSRWVKEDTWPLLQEAFFSQIPIPFKWVMPGIIRKDVKNTLRRQGYGRHSETELLSIADEHFSALSTLLGENKYCFGEQVSSFDAIAYAALCEFISVDFPNSFNQQARKYDNLIQYCQRIEAEYYT